MSHVGAVVKHPGSVVLTLIIEERPQIHINRDVWTAPVRSVFAVLICMWLGQNTKQLGFLPQEGSGYWKEIYIMINQDLQFWCSTLETKGEALPVLNYLSTMPWESGGIALPFITSALFGAVELHFPSALPPPPSAAHKGSLCVR
jgi:hypothetical protein